jgi:hypothetical protein
MLRSVAGIVIWLLFCGCQRNAVPDSEYSGFGLMPNPGVYSTYLCGLELAELGTHEYVTFPTKSIETHPSPSNLDFSDADQYSYGCF